MITGNNLPKVTHFSGSPVGAGNTSGTIYTTSARCKYAIVKIATSHAAQGGFIYRTSNSMANFLCGNHAGSNVAGVAHAEVALPPNTLIGFFSNNTSQLTYSVSVEEYF